MQAEPDSSAQEFGSIRFARGFGAHVWSVDGRRFIDLVCGQGPIILGHADPRVNAAVIQQLNRGTLFPGPGPEVDELSHTVLAHFPHHEEIELFKTGSEAVAAAIRLSRAATGRQRILRVGFLGWHDQVVSPYVRCHSYDENRYTHSWPHGIPHESLRPLMDLWLGHDPVQLLDLIRAAGDQLAAVIVDPVQLFPPSAASIAKQISLEVRSRGAFLVFDESKTGFRVSMGGAQAVFGVRADLTILSKAIANGFPLAAVLGHAGLKQLAADCKIKGTFRLEAIAIAAALATIRVLEETNAPFVLNAKSELLLSAVNDAFRGLGLDSDMVQAVPYQWPCLPYIRFRGDLEDVRRAFFHELAVHGVLMMRDHMSYVPLALSDDDLDAIGRSVKTASLAIREALAP